MCKNIETLTSLFWAADVVSGLLTVLARVVARSHGTAETRAELAERFAPALVGEQPVDFDAVSTARHAGTILDHVVLDMSFGGSQLFNAIVCFHKPSLCSCLLISTS